MRTLVGLAAAATIATLLTTTTAARAADEGHCVTKAEFKAVKTEQTKKHVEAVWGTKGHLVSGSSQSEHVKRGYAHCGQKGTHVWATFDFDEDTEDWYLTEKTYNTNATPGCVSADEFYGVHHGQTKHHVEAVWGTKGHRTDRQGDTISKGYKLCGIKDADQVIALYDLHENGTWYLREKTANAE